jgi:hypothetical protein
MRLAGAAATQGVAEDAIARLFRRYPGMEYCDLKKERATGKSKVCVSYVIGIGCMHVLPIFLSRPVIAV